MSILLTWKDAAGATTQLVESNGYRVLRGAMGLGVAAPQNTIDSYFAFDGAALSSRRKDVLPLVLPMHVTHPTRVQTRLAQLAKMLVGPGELEYNDGTNIRTLRRIIYEGGLGGDMSNAPSPLWRKVVVALLALDPWWYGAAQSVALSVSAPTAFSAAIPFSASIPFDGGSTVSIVIAGDGAVFPVITVTGPATTLVVGVGSLAWAIAAPLLTGDVLVVDTRPGNRGPRKNGGTVDWSLLTPASRLWTLNTGTQSLVSGVVGGSGATSITMTYEPRYLTP